MARLRNWSCPPRGRAGLAQPALVERVPDGELHYAVCTLNPEENEQIAEATGLEAGDELRTWPDEGDDGFYAARLR